MIFVLHTPIGMAVRRLVFVGGWMTMENVNTPHQHQAAVLEKQWKHRDFVGI